MKDERETKVQVIAELNQARQTIADLTRRLEVMKGAESDLRRLERALRESETTLQTFFDAIPEPAFLIDREGNFLALSSSLARRFGRSPDELVGTDAFALLSPTLARRRWAYVDEAIRTGQLIEFEDARAGRSFVNYICPVADAEGVVTRIAVFALDITARKEIEKQLRASEDLYRSVFEVAPEGIVVVGVDGVVASCNPAFVRLSGYPADMIVGKHFSQLPTIRLGDIPWFVKSFLSVLRGGASGPIEFPWVRADGNRRWGEARVVLIREGGKLKGIQAIVHDITERKRQGQLLEALNKAAQATARSLTPAEIFAAIAEEFETLGFACSIMVVSEDRRTVSPKYLSYGSKLIRAAERLVGFKIDGFTLPVDSAEEYHRVINRRETVFVEHAEDFMRRVLPDTMQPLIGRIRQMLNVPRFILAPLVVEDTVIGILTVQSDNLLASDVAAVTAFAHQVSGAWEKAQLLEQMRQEVTDRRRAVTDRRRAEETLRDSEERFRVAFRTSPDAININRLSDGLYVDINEGFTALTGYTRADVIGKTSLEIDIWVDPADRARLVADLREKGRVSNLEAPFRFKDGRVRVGLMSARVLMLDGAPHVLSVTRDITERVHLEELMRQSAKMVSVGQLAAGVAHEINNPLGAMIQSAQMVEVALDVERARTRQMLDEYGIDPERLRQYLADRGTQEYLSGIRYVGGRAAKIVTDLLGFSRQTATEMRRHDLNDLVQRAMELARTGYDLSGRYRIQNLAVAWELAEGELMVECDGQQIQQVVLNLVSNAAQAMGEGGGQLTLRTSRVKGCVRMEVEDTGPGVPESMRARLFEPFFTTKGVGEGTGLGLWLCWSIVVERHSGRIWVDDGSKNGARFVVELPVCGESQYNRHPAVR
jgi:PAS domain S-box-containing protein